MRKRIVVPGSGTVLTEPGHPDAPAGSRSWALHFIWVARERAHDAHLNVSSLQKVLKRLKEESAHKAVGFASYSELLEREIKITEAQADAIMAAPPDVTVATVLGKNGRPKKGEENCNNVTVSPPVQRGNNATYLLTRLARDGHTEILSRIDAGEISVRQGAIEAGFVREPDPLAQALKLLPKLKPDELDDLISAAIEAKSKPKAKPVAKAKPKAKRK